MKKTTFILLIFINYISFSQVAIEDLNPNAHGQLDVSATAKGVPIPRITLSALDNPFPFDLISESLLIFNKGDDPTVPSGYYYWQSNQWNKLITPLDLSKISTNSWFVENSTIPATENTQNIYQEGRVGIGASSMTPEALLDVRGDALINGLTVGRGPGNSTTNTTIGAFALKNNSTGDYNIAVGMQALRNNIKGVKNVAIGSSSSFHNKANLNIGIGFETLYNNGTGSRNTAIGSYALNQNTIGNDNIAIGHNAGSAYNFINLNNTISIGSNAQVTKSNTIQLGNEDIENVYTSGNFNIGNTTKNANLNVAGEVIIEKTEPLLNAKTLVIDHTGKVGIAPVIPSTETVAKVMFAQSEARTDYTTTVDVNLINSGNPFVVKWLTDEIVVNNVVDFTVSDNSFSIKDDGVYEVSGFLNYNPNATTPATYTTTIEQATAAVNVTIQVQKTGTNTWIDLASVRYLFVGPNVQGTATIVIPPAIMTFKKADKIRMIFKRPSSTFGLSHGIFGSPCIAIPEGVLFSKGIKILRL